MEDTITFSHSHKFGKNIALFSESICQHTSFEIFESIIRALRYWEENSLFDQNSQSQYPDAQSHILTLSHVWHKMAVWHYVLLKAFVEKISLIYLEQNSEH